MRANLPALAAASLVATTGCWSHRDAGTGPLAPELTLQQVDFQIDQGGVIRARGQAERVAFRRDTSEVAASVLDLTLAGAEGAVRLTAPEASGNTASRHFRASGGLMAVRGQDVATTPSASYDVSPDHPRGLVRGDEPVQVTGPGYQLDGQRFVLDPASGDIDVAGGARLATGLLVTR